MRREDDPPRASAPPGVADGSTPYVADLGEQELIRLCRAGDRAAFERFYQSHRRMVAANLFRVMGDRSELDDLVQEVFVIAFRGMDRFRGDSKLSTWLYRICVNVALGKLRTKARKPPPISTDQPGHAIESSVEDSPDSPEKLLLRREDVARVYRALDQLSPKKRIVMVMHEIEGMDIKEIAAVVGAPLVTVRTRLHYARKEFYKIVADEAALGCASTITSSAKNSDERGGRRK